jgi:nicotinamide phosphoribosyltransferase
MPQPLRVNNLVRTDSYKVTHWPQYPKDTRTVYSYLESRGGMFDQALVSMFQYYTKAYLEGKYFTEADIDYARDFSAKHFGNPKLFNEAGWRSMLKKHGGRLPVLIKALPEGHLVEGHNCLMTIENTDPEFYWLTNWLETMMLKVWYPITVGTLSFNIRQVIGKALVRTGDPADLPFKLHDFGYRGVSSEESAAIGGAAHLINFMGTDTQASIELLRQFYGADMPAYSIPASEHSTMTAWGKENEQFAYANMLDKYPEGLVACVSDSYDIRNAVEKLWGGVLRERVNSRNGTLVIRPDSGDPVAVLADVFDALEAKFGLDDSHLGTHKGWKVLSPRVRVIQGDGVNFHTIQNMVSQLTRKGWSMSNWGFGMGGALLQQLNRDTLRFAFKCSAIDRGGVWHDVWKDPVTDPGKTSQRGRFSVSFNGHRFVTSSYSDTIIHTGDMLRPIFKDGEVLTSHTLDDLRANAAKYDTYTTAAAP